MYPTEVLKEVHGAPLLTKTSLGMMTRPGRGTYTALVGQALRGACLSRGAWVGSEARKMLYKTGSGWRRPGLHFLPDLIETLVLVSFFNLAAQRCVPQRPD